MDIQVLMRIMRTTTATFLGDWPTLTTPQVLLSSDLLELAHIHPSLYVIARDLIKSPAV